MKKQLILLLLFISLPAQAIVNLEEIHINDVEHGISGAMGLDLNGSRGNSDKTNTQFSALLRRGAETTTDTLMASYRYGKANGQLSSDSAFIHLRHIQKVDYSYAWELFAQLQSDHFARLSLRSLVGGGMRYKLIESDNRTIFGMGAFYEQERINEDSLHNNEEREQQNWRANIYSIIGHKINQNSNLYGTLYIQPRLNKLDDYRLLLQSGIKVKVAGNLDLKIGLDAKYDSEPPFSVEKYDINYHSGLEYHF